MIHIIPALLILILVIGLTLMIVYGKEIDAFFDEIEKEIEEKEIMGTHRLIAHQWNISVEEEP